MDYVVAEQANSGDAASAQSTGKTDPQAPGWIRRVRIGKQPPDRALCPERVCALEQTIRSYADKLGDHVIEPEIGLTFDSLGEAYDFYNLYSWELGFGIRYRKSRLNAEKTKCMQEVVYGCSGKPIKENIRSCRCECPAMIRLLRSHDNGWYITEHAILCDGWALYIWDMLTMTIQVYNPSIGPKGCNKDPICRHELIESCLHDALFGCLNDFHAGWPTPKDNWSIVSPLFLDTTISREETGVCVMHIIRYHDGEKLCIPVTKNNLLKTKRTLLQEVMKLQGNNSFLPADALWSVHAPSDGFEGFP